MTGGASLLFTTVVGGGANVVGGVIERSIDGDEGSETFDVSELASDILSGAIGAAVGYQIQALLKANLPLPEWAKSALREAKRKRRIAKNRLNTRPNSAETLTEDAAASESFVDKILYLWPAGAARGGTKGASKEVVKSTIRFLTPEEEKKLLEKQ